MNHTVNIFEEQFDKLTRIEKVNFAINLLKGVKKATDYLNSSQNLHFSKMAEAKKEGDLKKYEQAEFLFRLEQKQDAAFSKIKNDNLCPLKEINLEEIKALTPEMEQSIKGFVKSFYNPQFKMDALSKNPIDDAIFSSNKKIDRFFCPKNTNSVVEDICEKIKDKEEKKKVSNFKIK